MRKQALKLGKISPGMKVIDVGAGTGFATEGIIELTQPENVIMVDQSSHQLERAKTKSVLSRVEKKLGDAENIPFPDDTFDCYVSAGSIEYWPDPQQGIAESYRVIKPGGNALLIGPVQVRNRIFRLFSDMWMLFPSIQNYFDWYKKAGFTDIEHLFVSPEWVKGEPYGIVISGKKPKSGKSPIHKAKLKETSYESMGFFRRIKFFYRFFLGSFFGFIFVPVAIIGSLKTTKQIRNARKN